MSAIELLEKAGKTDDTSKLLAAQIDDAVEKLKVHAELKLGVVVDSTAAQLFVSPRYAPKVETRADITPEGL